MAQNRKVSNSFSKTAVVSGIIGIAAALLITKKCVSSYQCDVECDSEEACSSTTNYAVIGTLAALLGAGAALMFAPQAGKIRQALSDKYDELSDMTGEIAENVSDYTNDLAGKAKKVVKKVSDQVEDIQEDYYEDIKDKINRFIELADVGMRIFNSLNKK